MRWPPAAVWRAAFWATAVFGFFWALRKVADDTAAFAYEDKVKHAAAFALLAWLGWQGGYRRAAKLGLGLLALGIGVEVAQSFLPWRSAEVADVMADSTGIVLGLLLAPRLTLPLARQPGEHGG